MEKDVVIIGAGPAGVTAAIQLKRSGLDPFLVEKSCVGGALLNASWVENYPGFPAGISGRDLVRHFEEHLKKLEIEVHSVTVGSLIRKDIHFILQCSEGEFRSRAVVVATGCIPKRLGIPGEKELAGKSVFYEVCDLPDYSGGTTCIVGGGDIAFDYALSLVQRNVDVVLVMRSRQPRCLSLLQRRVESAPKIRIIYDSEPAEFMRDGTSVRVLLRGEESTISCDFVLISIGREPNLGFVAPDLRPGNSVTQPLYFAGDVINGSFRQVGIAVGDGLRCAMDIARQVGESNRE